MNPFYLNGMAAGYVNLVDTIERQGKLVEVRGEKTREVLDATLIFQTGIRVPLPVGIGRGINRKLAAVEALALIAGTAERNLVIAAAPSYAKVLVSQSERDFHYAAYGPRVAPYLESIIWQLSTDPTTRQAVLSVWKADDAQHQGDRPCTLSIQFLIRDDHLHMIVNMRSNDVWLGFAYDAFVFSQLHWTIFREVQKTIPNLKVGWYRHHAGSLHLYRRDAEAVGKLTLGARSINPADRSMPYGVKAPRNWGVAEVALKLLHPDLDRPADMDMLAGLNPWYAAQLKLIDDSTEVVR